MKAASLCCKRNPWLLAMVAVAAACGWAEQAPTAANTKFDLYVKTIEARLSAEHHIQPPDAVVLGSGALSGNQQARLRQGELIFERITPAKVGEGAMLHHWRGTAFVKGARADDFSRLMKSFNTYPTVFAPQVVRASVLARNGDATEVAMRVRQHHVLTVVMDTTYAVRFGESGAHAGFSESRSTDIAEIQGAGTKGERRLSPREQHGFLWRMNTYWSYAEGDGGLWIQIESVSLTRDVPRGLGWAIGPFIESIPRESLEFTLSKTRDALLRR